MIVVKVLAWNELRVIHYSKGGFGQKAVIKAEDCFINPYYVDVLIINYDSNKSYSGQDALEGASKRFDERDYNLLFNNCESFCTWVKVNNNHSQQSETGMTLAAGAAVVGTVALLSFYVYRAFQGSNKK